MRKNSKINTIINAFTGELPIGEGWYEERLNICNLCEYNSANSTAESLKDKFKDLIHAGQPFCRICDCFIDRKSSMKEESCPQKKWDALMVHTISEEDWNLYNNTPLRCSIDLSEDGQRYEVHYKGTLKEADNSGVELVLEGNHSITEVKVSCGCTLASYTHIGDKLWRIITSLKIDMLSTGNFTKNVIVKYNTVQGEEKTLVIALKGKKQ